MRMLVAAFSAVAFAFGISSQTFATPVTDWSGPFFGVEAGSAWGDRTWDYYNIHPPTAPDPNPQDIGGTIYGAYAGAQVQWGAAVFGIEAQTLTTTDLTVSATCPYAGYSCTFSMPALFTVAPRAGFAMGNLMAYGTAGYAGASMTTNVTRKDNGDFVEGGSGWHNGWVAGGGVDWAATPNLIFGVQYLHVNLDDAEHEVPASNYPVENPTVSAAFDTIMARMSFMLH